MWCEIGTQNVQLHQENYRKNSKIWDTSNNCHNCPKIGKVWCNIALMHSKEADAMANSVDPDQTASSEAVWSWSALFAETYLSQYIEFLRYMKRWAGFSDKLKRILVQAAITIRYIHVNDKQGSVMPKRTRTVGSMLGWSQIVKDGRTNRQTGGEPDPYVTPCLRQVQ